MPGGMRREVYRDGSFIVKDAVGRVTEARAEDGATMSCSYDEKGHFKSFVRSDSKGKIVQPESEIGMESSFATSMVRFARKVIR